MRLLALFLCLLPCVAVGQTYLLPQDSVLYDHYTQGFLPRFLADWDAYRAECYNDSTRHDRRNDGWTYGENWLLPSTKDTNMVWRTYGENGIAVTEAKLRWYWTHREPTLEGFMQFLRRKVK